MAASADGNDAVDGLVLVCNCVERRGRRAGVRRAGVMVMLIDLKKMGVVGQAHLDNF
jgi:hypothetical protein